MHSALGRSHPFHPRRPGDPSGTSAHPHIRTSARATSDFGPRRLVGLIVLSPIAIILTVILSPIAIIRAVVLNPIAITLTVSALRRDTPLRFRALLGLGLGLGLADLLLLAVLMASQGQGVTSWTVFG